MNAELPPELSGRRDEILRRATRRGTHLRIRRRVAIVAVGAFAVSAVVGSAFALTGDDHRARVVTSAPDSASDTTSTADATSTTVADSTTEPTSTVVTPTTSVSDTTVGVPVDPGTTDTTALVCHDSYDPRCGPLTFTSTPVNQPLALSVDPTVTGSSVKLVVHASDDAAVDACVRIEWGDGTSSTGGGSIGGNPLGCIAAGTCVMFRTRYGPWDVPPPTPDSLSAQFTHAYVKAATFVVTVDADSADPCSPDQFYASQATDTLHVAVMSVPPTSAP